MGSHYLVHTERPVTLDVLERLASARRRRRSLPLAATVEKRLTGLDDLPSFRIVPWRLRIRMSSEGRESLLASSEAVEELRRYGWLILEAPLHFVEFGEGFGRAPDSGCSLHVGLDRFFLSFSIDRRKVERAEDRRRIFEALEERAKWPIEVGDFGDDFRLRMRSGRATRFSKKRVDQNPSMVHLQDPEKGTDDAPEWSSGWQSGLPLFWACRDTFGPTDVAWTWRYELLIPGLRQVPVEAEPFWSSLRALGLPGGDGTVTFDTYLDDVAALEAFRQTLAAGERSVTDLVVFPLAAGYKANVDVITTSVGHFVEADLRGGWGEQERRAFEDLLGVPLVDGSQQSADEAPDA